MLAPLQGRALGIFLRHCPQLQELCLLGDPVVILVDGCAQFSWPVAASSKAWLNRRNH